MTQSGIHFGADLEGRLQFETLLADLSSYFVNLPPEQVDHAIHEAQRRIVEALALDRSALWQLLEGGQGALRLTHFYQRGLPVLAGADSSLVSKSDRERRSPESFSALRGADAKALFPCTARKVLRGEMVLISKLDDLPAEAAQDKENFRRIGTKSIVVVPLLAGGAVIGVLTFGVMWEERAWSEPLAKRFQLVAQVFGNALARKRADKALRESEARLSLAAASADADLWELEVSTGRLWNTGRGRQLLGLAPEETYDFERFLSCVHPEDRERVRRAVQQAMRSGQTLSGEYRIVRPDGSVRWIGTRGRPQYGSSGEADRLMGVSIDITERKRKDEQLEGTLREIEELKQQLEQDNISLQEEVKLLSPHEEIVGQSAALRQVLAQVEKVAPTDSTVLIVGETGTGKELIARAIHNLSRRAGRALVMADCASLPPSLIEGELFGREKGAYTGAMSRMAGRFEVADGSTLFLDEIGELPLEVQAKLLRVLEEGRFERLGSTKTVQVNVRILAATNRDLTHEAQEGKFRKDLYFRLNVFPILIPPLRDRPEDIPPLVWAFVRQFEKRMGKRVESISKRSLEALQHYAWPGNVRELRNVIEHAMIVSHGKYLEVRPATLAPADPSGDGRSLEEIERQHILSVLRKTGWRVTGKGAAAEILGLKRTTLEARMKKLRITRPNRKANMLA